MGFSPEGYPLPFTVTKSTHSFRYIGGLSAFPPSSLTPGGWKSLQWGVTHGILSKDKIRKGAHLCVYVYIREDTKI